MLIALDYDGTYSAAPDTFRAVIRCFQSTGHTVKIVTMRSREVDYLEEFDDLRDKYNVDTIFCDGNPKRKFCADLNIFPDVWIDDYPEGIHLGSQYTKEELEVWRKEQAA